MRIALAQLNFHIGNFEENKSKIVAAIKVAKIKQADLVVFPELAISGYPPKDFLEFDHFIEKCWQTVQEITEHCTDIAAIVGLPLLNKSEKGKRLHNGAVFIADGKIQSEHHKSLLPTYDVFDEYRYFQQAEKVECIHYKNEIIALTICEDLWGIGEQKLYNEVPMDALHKEQPTCAINIAASPFSTSHFKERLSILKANAKLYNIPFYYVNHYGAQTELIFDGNSAAVYPNGKAHIAKDFSEDLLLIDTAKELTDNTSAKQSNKMQRMHKALVTGVKHYFSKLGFTKAMLGMSGGIDSALTLAIACEALGAENVTAVMMPSQFSSGHSVSDSEDMIQRLGCEHTKIAVQNVYQSFMQQLQPDFEGTEFGLAEENLQARIRGTLLMSLSNKFGKIVLNTSNKSEAAVGYGTLYGDMCGGLSVIGDVYKTDVYELCRYINTIKPVIPENIITKEPSAELRADQKDSDSLPEYEVLDAILYQYIEMKQDISSIIKQGFEENTVKKVLRLVNLSEYKRYQMPPVLRVSTKSFGSGRLMPLVAKYLS
jgi:NAD+ synthase (glutamine-hydrolysing)